jgi:CRP/FNR family cyclic AMP-dependent transcriptional regulator
VAKPDARIIDALRQVPLFADLTDKELRQVADLVREEHFREGEDIVVEGHSSGPLFLIVAGEATVLVHDVERGRYGPGDSLGEMSLIDRRPRAATVRARTDVTALAISSWDFLGVLEHSWPVTIKVLTQMSDRIRQLDQNPCL